MIILKTLEWGNWFSYGDNNKIDFTSSTVTQILGNNGNGKSSIPLIIEEVLYNKNAKGLPKSDILNRNSAKDYYWAILNFSVNGVDYTIEYKRGSALKLKLFKEGEDISSHTSTNTFKQIEQILGRDFKTFDQLVYQNPKTSLQFLSATDTGRKKFLIDLFNLEDYVSIHEVFKTAVKSAESQQTELKGSIKAIKTSLDRLESSDIEFIPLKEFPDNYEEILASSEKDLAELQNSLNHLKETNTKISKNNSIKTMMSNIKITEIQDSLEPIKDSSEVNKKLSACRANIAIFNNEITRASKHKSKISDLGHSCPTCEQDITEEFKSTLISNEQEIIEENKRLLEQEKEVEQSLLQELKSIESHNARVRFLEEEVKKWENLYSIYDDSLPKTLLDKDDIEQKAEQLRTFISNLRKDIKSITEHNTKAASNNSKIEYIKDEINQARKQLDDAQTKLDEITGSISELVVLRDSFSTNGLIAYKLENLVKDLENLTNHYLAELSDGRFAIEFKINSDKLDVGLTDNSNLISINALSSGELARVNTATLLAIRKLLASISKSKINLLFLDEVISVLDTEGRETLVDILIKEENLNTFVVSHAWSHPLLAKIEIVKENEMSRVEIY